MDICPASFRETCEWLKFPLIGLQAKSRVSAAVGLLPSASGLAFLGMAFPTQYTGLSSFVIRQRNLDY